MVLNTMTQAIKYKIKDDNVSTSEDLFNHFNVGANPFLKWAGGK